MEFSKLPDFDEYLACDFEGIPTPEMEPESPTNDDLVHLKTLNSSKRKLGMDETVMCSKGEFASIVININKPVKKRSHSMATRRYQPPPPPKKVEDMYDLARIWLESSTTGDARKVEIQRDNSLVVVTSKRIKYDLEEEEDIGSEDTFTDRSYESDYLLDGFVVSDTENDHDTLAQQTKEARVMVIPEPSHVSSSTDEVQPEVVSTPT